MLVLGGIAVVVVGFALRLHPLLVIVVSALVTGLAAGFDPLAVIAALGKAFNDSRYISLVWLVLPAIGVLERAGLQQRARQLVTGLRTATTGRLLAAYFVLRQLTAALGLTSLGGHAQMVRPLIAPMAEAAAESRLGPLSQRIRDHVRAQTAAVDNIALFFGEDIFIAIGSILLMVGFLHNNGHTVEPLRLALWAIPSAVAALLIHGFRLWRLDRQLARAVAEERAA
ncbi:DUF969 domain-containing protein [Nevskia sp.]|uniref:DUF969 domain-containing protein n=1 Tax=Nevskia sp. TaxID=1929292 RepID=UPI0025E6AB5B|nr:DUF969 domain-containing protein [Nevskia sp.]